MLSRVANSVYWLARYLERVENYSRFLIANINLSFDLGVPVEDRIHVILKATCDEVFFQNFVADDSRDKLFLFVTFSYLNPNSLYNSLKKARENAKSVREVVPKELWEGLNATFLEFNRKADEKNLTLISLLEVYEWLKQRCQYLNGMLDATLSRNEVFYFYNLGKFIERADKTSRVMKMLDNTPGSFKSPLDASEGAAILKAASAFNMYRQLHKRITRVDILLFLTTDCFFPRSLLYSTKEVCESLKYIEEISGIKHELSSDLSPLIIKLKNLTVSDIELLNFINEFQSNINHLDNMIFNQYFGGY